MIRTINTSKTKNYEKFKFKNILYLNKNLK